MSDPDLDAMQERVDELAAEIDAARRQAHEHGTIPDPDPAPTFTHPNPDAPDGGDEGLSAITG